MKYFRTLFYISISILSLNSFGQEVFEAEKDEQFRHHSIAIFISHTRINEGVSDGEKKAFSAPSWVLDYNYAFNEKWIIGLHNDIIIENFEVEKTSGGEIIERKTPITSVIVGAYRITNGFAVELGGGMEFEKDENFAVIRLGAGYGIEIPKSKLEVLFGIDYDFIINTYNSFSIGIGVAKWF